MPDSPGVVALGSTRPGVAERIREALSVYSEDLRERGQTLPVPHHAAGTIAA
jgi:predicted RNase H-like HicB family nuclease